VPRGGSVRGRGGTARERRRARGELFVDGVGRVEGWGKCRGLLAVLQAQPAKGAATKRAR
jgi:hypothetical protein